MKLTDYHFKIGKFENYLYTFKLQDVRIEEYIHCIVKEHLEVDYEKAPTKIKVLQIHNLEEYVNGNESNTSERILTVSELKPIKSIK